ncbi:hypothetical protein A3G68_05490 [Candidatus Gottesmanbacteria bacterium RIFCSPLOWO2_12_FULL_42_10]|nr:MAG: hypothetical protein A3G68_05490 [Candidatus Gottesmanbacteria bacterium RIFCSPLOWO2_12_FULL_42_10]
MAHKLKALLALGTTVVLFSFLVILARFYAADVPSMSILFLRLSFAALAFLPFLVRSRIWQKEHFSKLVVISLLSTVNLVFFMFGIEFTTASASQLIYAATPILTIIISGLLYREKYSGKTLSGVTIGLLGIFYIVYRSAIEKGETISGGLFGNMMMLVAATGWLFYILFSKKISKSFTPAEIGGTSVIVSFFFSIILLAIQLSITGRQMVLDRNILLATFYMGIGGTFFTYLLLQYAIKHLSSLTVNLTSYIQPALVALLAIFFLNEKLTAHYIFGSLLVFLSVFLTVTIEFMRLKKRTN